MTTADDDHFRRSPRDFSRNGILNPQLLVTLLLYMVADGTRRGCQLLLDGFWDEAQSYGLDLPCADPVSDAAFCKARRKITSEHLRYMLHELDSTFFEETFGPSQRWHGKRVFAIDGTKINLQRGYDLEVAYGIPSNGHNPQVLVSVLLDVCAKAPVDLEIAAYGSSEREQLFDMLPSIERGDVLVLDRGYPSHEVLQALVERGIEFLIRVPSSETFAVIDHFRESGDHDRMYSIGPPKGSPPEWKPLSVRAVRLKNADGEESFFLTTLPAPEFDRQKIRELYHMRWESEEFYKLMKSNYIGQGQFRSKTPEGVEQEIHALVLFLAIARVLMVTAAEVEGVDYCELSQKTAVLALADYMTRLFLAGDEDVALQAIRAMQKRVLRNRERPRPGRSYPRRSFRPRLRWGTSGRCGG